jgi:hypothetical protein
MDASPSRIIRTAEQRRPIVTSVAPVGGAKSISTTTLRYHHPAIRAAGPARPEPSRRAGSEAASMLLDTRNEEGDLGIALVALD